MPFLITRKLRAKFYTFFFYLQDTQKSFDDFRLLRSKGKTNFTLDPLQPSSGRLAITAHIYYREWLDMFLERLPEMKDLGAFLITTPFEEFKVELEDCFRRNEVRGKVVLCQNIGRNFGPLMVELSKELLKFDFFIHVHSKKSTHAPLSKGKTWQERNSQFLLNPLRIRDVLRAFNQEKTLGLMYVDCTDLVRGINFRWGMSRRATQQFFKSTKGFQRIRWRGRIDFPAGGMFAARVSAIQEVLELDWRYADFPKESGQLDGTLQHGIERIIGELVTSKGLKHLTYSDSNHQYSVIQNELAIK